MGAALFIAGIVILFFAAIRGGYRAGRFRRNFVPPLPFLSLSKEDRELLVRHFLFYRKLPPKSKGIFEYRVAKFIGSKNFIARNLPEVTNEMKLFIGAAAIQITFGLPRVYLSHFKNILVYPDAYYSTITRRYHHGEVNPRLKAIVLSWRAFVEGYADEEGENLGLHEMAHALSIENLVRNKEYNFLPKAALQKWDELASTEMKKMEEGEADPFFRKYATTDHHEFFAVAVENFFERPHAFHQYHPVMYGVLTDILNQDPLVLQS